jgi:YD repeat-containing protein
MHSTRHNLYLTSATDALNHTITATYNFNTGLVTSITNAKGNSASFEYDILGRVTKRINPDLTEVEAVYNDQENSITIYDELDHYTIQYFDGIGRLERAEWYLSPTVYLTETYIYNYQDKIVAKTDPGGHVYSCEYDSWGRPTKIYNPDSTYKQVLYDDVMNTVVTVDENLHKKEYHYDWVQNLLRVKEYTDPVNYYLTQYTYDTGGNLTSVTNAQGNTTLYRYDSLFGVTQVMYPDSTSETCTYDASGSVFQRTNASGTTHFTYNSINQLTEVLYPDQTSVIYQYDEIGNCISMTDPAGQTSFVYDNRNRCTSETRTINGVPYTITYTYDSGSRLTSSLYPDQSIITYQYDTLNRLTDIPGYAQLTYNADSLLASMTYNNGTETLFQYDDCHRLTTFDAQINNTPLLSMSYQYDPVGNITQWENSRRKNETWVQSMDVFQYDWLD